MLELEKDQESGRRLHQRREKFRESGTISVDPRARLSQGLKQPAKILGVTVLGMAEKNHGWGGVVNRLRISSRSGQIREPS